MCFFFLLVFWFGLRLANQNCGAIWRIVNYEAILLKQSQRYINQSSSQLRIKHNLHCQPIQKAPELINKVLESNRAMKSFFLGLAIAVLQLRNGAAVTIALETASLKLELIKLLLHFFTDKLKFLLLRGIDLSVFLSAKAQTHRRAALLPLRDRPDRTGRPGPGKARRREQEADLRGDARRAALPAVRPEESAGDAARAAAKPAGGDPVRKSAGL